MNVDGVELFGMLRTVKGGVEDLDNLLAGQLARVVIDLDRAGNRARLVAIDPDDAQQLTFDRPAKPALAVQQRIFHPQAAGPVDFDFPLGTDAFRRRVDCGLSGQQGSEMSDDILEPPSPGGETQLGLRRLAPGHNDVRYLLNP